jgi:hypothetical protein
MTIAYVMWSARLSLEAAWALVKGRRPRIGPNAGFRAQLARWQSHLIATGRLPPNTPPPTRLLPPTVSVDADTDA